VVTYQYDAYGNILSMTSSAVAQANPYRYRGYRYDDESGFYYLNARYYNPEIGRFISADPLLKASNTVLGHNMFAYTENNPVMYTDYSGNAICLAHIDINNSDGDRCLGPSSGRTRSNNSGVLSQAISQINSFIENLNLAEIFDIGYVTANFRIEMAGTNSFTGLQGKASLLRLTLQKDIGDFYIKLIIDFGAIEVKAGIKNFTPDAEVSVAAISGRVFIGGVLYGSNFAITFELGIKFSVGKYSLGLLMSFDSIISMIFDNSLPVDAIPYLRYNIKIY